MKNNIDTLVISSLNGELIVTYCSGDEEVETTKFTDEIRSILTLGYKLRINMENFTLNNLLDFKDILANAKSDMYCEGKYRN